MRLVGVACGEEAYDRGRIEPRAAGRLFDRAGERGIRRGQARRRQHRQPHLAG
jgi:hypothetical protein